MPRKPYKRKSKFAFLKETHPADQMDESIRRVRTKWAAKILRGCRRACFVCERLVPFKGTCTGMRPCGEGRAASEKKPLCHVELGTGKMRCPIGRDGRLMPGQERFYPRMWTLADSGSRKANHE